MQKQGSEIAGDFLLGCILIAFYEEVELEEAFESYIFLKCYKTNISIDHKLRSISENQLHCHMFCSVNRRSDN